MSAIGIVERALMVFTQQVKVSEYAFLYQRPTDPESKIEIPQV
jgi:hypothetical protein